MRPEPCLNEQEVIFAYTRANAIEDGVLVDVTTLAKREGSRVDAVFTAALFANCEEETEATERPCLQELLALGYRKAKEAGSTVDLIEAVLPWDEHRKVWFHTGPGDAGECVLTVMFPEDW